ncbi:SF3a splicing factor complex subunit [Komagataella phaffii CBS 7435]|uniref:SF3a splicing factor complex subunit n=1 Tax=Komagataella phaffii (strain ATCC 76273 / CBS 7435 / CECT 11047 / NRRL Y-11430 / Wegner 21-1) TaxID=981350 RepID=F2R094_KOMPC|nr:GQ67_04404T0 [Komagataella phaffii]CAH2451334.1 SF3a splicing factor complex subunit [Komagataella phaffii CBS 7435]CCA41072.1 SF3a splicing factor complex subunit [Komagataella phaffii CBS 7435]
MVQDDIPEDIPEGVILPPPAVQEIINKTAGYVHRNGASFETRIKEKELHNNKFQFLIDEDPYNAFYKWKLEQLKNNQTIDTASNEQFQDRESKVQEISRPKDLEFLVDFKPMSSLDHDIIKLTALYVAVDKTTGDGVFRKKFEQSFGGKNAQFGFLDPTHSLNSIFNQYVNQYTLLLRLMKDKEKSDIFAKIELGCNSVHSFLDKSFSRAEYLQQEKMKEEHKKAKDEAMMLEFASIDWQDFTLVQVIEFTEEDFHSELSQPLNLSELQYRSLEEKSSGLLIEEAPPDFQETEEPKIENVPRRKVPKGMKIRAAGETRLGRMNEPKEKLIKCPLTGELVPESKFQDHINVLLRDPKYKEERARYEAKVSKSNLTTDEVLNNVSILANARKIREAKQSQSQLNTEDSNRKRPLQWDGYSASTQTIKKQAKQMYSAEEIEEQKRRRKESLNRIGSHKPQ